MFMDGHLARWLWSVRVRDGDGTLDAGGECERFLVRSIQVLNPTSEEVIASVASSGVSDVQRALVSSRRSAAGMGANPGARTLGQSGALSQGIGGEDGRHGVLTYT
jgi:acyl-CoA reductase-like NAD-dependent aldehyde dehydrogenase